MNGKIFRITILLFISCILLGCKELPLPPEVEQATRQELNLWKSGAEVYAPDEYARYKAALRTAKDKLIQENSKLIWFRNYDDAGILFTGVLARGQGVEKTILLRRDSKEKEVAVKLSYLSDRITTLKKLTTLINEGRLSRGSLIKAEVLLAEAQTQKIKGRYEIALGILRRVSVYTDSAVESISHVLTRFTNKNQIDMWKTWVHETVNESGGKGNYSIIVSKLDKKLILYKEGKPYMQFTVGIGLNGSSDKLYAGDRATPEGKYFITNKKHRSHYYKALLINYPNEYDRRQFAIARKKGLIPASAGIGGLIEIHGGGKEGMTYGCVSMENSHIDKLFNLVDVGTPVTIVGAVEYENIISSTMGEL